jgi:hypothetical protein
MSKLHRTSCNQSLLERSVNKSARLQLGTGLMQKSGFYKGKSVADRAAGSGKEVDG